MIGGNGRRSSDRGNPRVANNGLFGFIALR